MRFVDNPQGPTLAAVAGMHHSELPLSLISKLGLQYTLAFYNYAASSPHELVMAAVDDEGTVAGGGFVSFSPQDLPRRMVLRTPLVSALLCRPRLAAQLAMDQVRGLVRNGDDPETDPELIALFVRNGDRSRGIGAKALAHIESVLRTQNRTRYFIRTTEAPDNRAIAFYMRAGFETVRSVTIHGEAFRFMAKRLTGA